NLLLSSSLSLSSTSSSHATSTNTTTSSGSSSSTSSSNGSSSSQKPTMLSPFFAPLPPTTWSPTAAALALTRDIASMNTTILADLQGLSSIPRIYTTLFHRTREFAATVRHFASVVAAGSWAAAACLLVDWGVHVLRHPRVGLERFLNSQRESLYWILDDALLRICLDMWDPPREQQACQRKERVLPWDEATDPIVRALAKAQGLGAGLGADGCRRDEEVGGPCLRGRPGRVVRGGLVSAVEADHEEGGEGPVACGACECVALGDLRELYFPAEKQAFG
ncbi:hypothetical protein J3E73DRAFT_362400, partial [Bipolaris maydis]